MIIAPELEYLHALQEHLSKPPEDTPMPLTKGWGTPAPFPVDALPPVLKAAALAINDKVQAPISICGQSVLAAATLAVQGHADVLLPTGHKKPLSCYFVSIAESGERKSSVDSEAMRSVKQREKSLDVQYRHDIKDHRDALDAWETARNKIKKGDKSSATTSTIKASLAALGDAPDAPLLPILTCPEPTFEGLCKLYAEGHPSLGIFSAEGGQFLGGHGMNKDNKMRTVTALSELWDGEAVKRVRAGEGSSQLNGRRLSSHLQMQPNIAQTLMADDMLIGQGYLSRTLVVAPESTSGTRFSKPLDPMTTSALDTYHMRMEKLLGLPLPLAAGSRNELDPRELPLSVGAKADWFCFADDVEAKVGPDGEYEPIKGLANKLPEHAARLAAVMALVEDENIAEVGTTHLEAGIRLVQHYASEALRLYGASKVPANVRMAQRVLHWLQHHWKKPMVSLVDIYKNNNQASSRDLAQEAVDVLVAHGWLKLEEGPMVVAGTRRRTAWRVISG